jgi:hypothetical protein
MNEKDQVLVPDDDNGLGDKAIPLPKDPTKQYD